MFFLLQRVGGAHHKNESMHPDDRLLQPDKAHIENITHDNNSEGHQHHKKR